MKLCCIRYLMFTKNKNVKMKCKIDEKINPHSLYMKFCSTKLETIDLLKF